MEQLHNKGFKHLKTRVRGESIAIYSEYNGIKENRFRLTRESNKNYILSIANHNGKWEYTPHISQHKIPIKC